jgi:hypothetical protein
LRDLVIAVLHGLRHSRTLHTLTSGPISGGHFRLPLCFLAADLATGRNICAAEANRPFPR